MSYQSQFGSSATLPIALDRSLQSNSAPAHAPQFSKSVFLIGRLTDTLQPIEDLLAQLKCDVSILPAVEQMRACTTAKAPCLVIVADDDHDWTEQSLRQLSQIVDTNQVTLVTLSDRYSPWLSVSTSRADVDGHLVSPINRSVLGSLVHSAAVRQFCHLVSVQ